MNNPSENSTLYINAVTDILFQCKYRFKDLRWIINTMGMCNDMGLKFIVHTILHSEPTFVVQIDSKVKSKCFQFQLQDVKVQEFYEQYGKYDNQINCCTPPKLQYEFVHVTEVEGCDKHNTSRSPKDNRFLNYLAYFGQLMNLNTGVKSLLEIRPYK